ncbi:MAG: iron-containing alcohol dehydrogenase [bacterium]
MITDLPLLPSQLLLPGRTLAADSAILQLGTEAQVFGTCGMLVHGRSLAASGKLAAILSAAPAGMAITCHAHPGGEPTTDEVETLRAHLRAPRFDWVAAVGGGSVIDLAKAAAGLRDAPERVCAYQAGNPIPPATLPLIAAPTTAGTGTEATVVSVLTDASCSLKQSIRHPSFMPRLVILDPTLLRSCPPATLAAAGMDAFVQAFESYTSRFATPLTRVLSELALVRIAGALPAVHDGDWSRASDLLQGSYLAGVALSHARLGVVHGLAHPLGARWHAAHGVVCAACFPAALRFNRPAIQNDLSRLRVLLGCDVEELVAGWMTQMHLASPFPGTRITDGEAIVREVLASGSTNANPRPVTAEHVKTLLADLFG